jgi:hypothetical protein
MTRCSRARCRQSGSRPLSQPQTAQKVSANEGACWVGVTVTNEYHGVVEYRSGGRMVAKLAENQPGGSGSRRTWAETLAPAGRSRRRLPIPPAKTCTGASFPLGLWNSNTQPYGSRLDLVGGKMQICILVRPTFCKFAEGSRPLPGRVWRKAVRLRNDPGGTGDGQKSAKPLSKLALITRGEVPTPARLASPARRAPSPRRRRPRP